jgi:hypothetical protein
MRRLLGLSVLLVTVQSGAQQPRGAAEPVELQMGSTVEPDTVTVGDPFRVTVRIRRRPIPGRQSRRSIRGAKYKGRIPSRST